MHAGAGFFVMAALDYVWARYTRVVISGHALRSANWAAAMQALTCVNTVLYTADLWVIPGVIAGAFLGTFLGVKRP